LTLIFLGISFYKNKEDQLKCSTAAQIGQPDLAAEIVVNMFKVCVPCYFTLITQTPLL